MTEIDKLVAEIDAFLAASGMASSTFGRKAVNDGKLVARLRSGNSVTLDKAAQIRRYIEQAALCAHQRTEEAA